MIHSALRDMCHVQLLAPTRSTVGLCADGATEKPFSVNSKSAVAASVEVSIKIRKMMPMLVGWWHHDEAGIFFF